MTQIEKGGSAARQRMQQSARISSELSRVGKLTNLSEQDYNSQYLYPLRYQGLSGVKGTTEQMNALKRNIAANRQRGGDKKKADALQAEYDWLNEHQYDYWSGEELDSEIESLRKRADAAQSRVGSSGNYQQTSLGQTRKTPGSGFMYDTPLGTETDKIESDARKEKSRIEAQIDALKSTKENNAYRDTMAGWDDQDFENMEELASLSGVRSDARSAVAAGAGRRSRGTHSKINEHNDRSMCLQSWICPRITRISESLECKNCPAPTRSWTLQALQTHSASS